MEAASHRACAHCRSQKVRCIPDETNPDICQRCARSGRSCVFTPLQKRKQRKRTDTRVAELEREMRSMRALLKNKQESGNASGSEQSIPSSAQQKSAGSSNQNNHNPTGLWFNDPTGLDNRGKDSVGFWVQNEGSKSGSNEGTTASAVEVLTATKDQNDSQIQTIASTVPERSKDDMPDVVDRGIVSMATARTLFEVYRNELCPHYPMVYIPTTITAEEMRASKPTLFLAVIAAAAMKADPSLSTTLDKEVLQTYAQRSMVNSEKSIEIVQALLVSAVWYHPPNKFGQLKYYQYIHWAATMAMDIRIGERPSATRAPYGTTTRFQQSNNKAPAVHFAEDVNNPSLSLSLRQPEEADTATIEARRTFLACFAICAGVSLSLRRPNMLRVNSYLRECIEYLQTSPRAVPSDRMFVAWCKLMVLSEEICQGFSYDDPGGIARIEDLRTQLLLKDFEKKLTDWEKSVPEPDFNLSLRIMYYTVRLHLNEIALHVDHNPDDFKAPYQMGSIAPRPAPYEDNDFPTQPLVDSISDSITSAQRLIDTFLRIDPRSARGLPVFTYVRVSLAAFVLAKLCLSAAHPEGRIYKILDRSALKVEGYMDRTILHVRNIIGPENCRVPAIFLALLFKLRSWCLHPELIEKYGEEHPNSIVAMQSDQAGAARASAAAGGGVHDLIRLPTSPRVAETAGSSSVGGDSPSTSGGFHGIGRPRTFSMSSSTDASPPASASAGAGMSVLNYEKYTDTGTPAEVGQRSRKPSANVSSNTSPSMAQSQLLQPQPNTTSAPPFDNSNNNTNATMSPWDDASLAEAMDLDPTSLSNNFYSIFGESAAFVEGGLTGLDDWASMPLPQEMFGPSQQLPEWMG